MTIDQPDQESLPGQQGESGDPPDFILQAMAEKMREEFRGLMKSDGPKYITLYFNRADYLGDMARFVNALTAKVDGLLRSERIHVGINAINVESALFEEIRGEIGAEEFGYEVV